MISTGFNIVISESIAEAFIKLLQDLSQTNSIYLNKKKEALTDLVPLLYKLLVVQIFEKYLAAAEEHHVVLQAWLSCLLVALVVPTERGQSFQSEYPAF